jgi:predicted AlkP superfamily phosphohydrolase/phosphomutase
MPYGFFCLLISVALNDWLAKQGLLSIRDLWMKVQGYEKKSVSLSSS